MSSKVSSRISELHKSQGHHSYWVRKYGVLQEGGTIDVTLGSPSMSSNVPLYLVMQTQLYFPALSYLFTFLYLSLVVVVVCVCVWGADSFFSL